MDFCSRGLLNTASGLTIAYLSGVDGSRPNQFTFGWDDVQVYGRKRGGYNRGGLD